MVHLIWSISYGSYIMIDMVLYTIWSISYRPYDTIPNKGIFIL